MSAARSLCGLLLVAITMTAAAIGCGGTTGTDSDAGLDDAGPNDAGLGDAGGNDAGVHDAGANDAGPDAGCLTGPLLDSLGKEQSPDRRDHG